MSKLSDWITWARHYIYLLVVATVAFNGATNVIPQNWMNGIIGALCALGLYSNGKPSGPNPDVREDNAAGK